MAIFLFGIGLMLGLFPTGGIANMLSESVGALEEFGSILPPFTLTMLAVIIIKNSLALLVSFALSPLLCVVPVLTLVLNGSVISFVSTRVVEEKSLGFLLAGLLPHGIFELPALIIGLAASLSFGAIIVWSLFSEEKRVLLLPTLKQDLKYLLIALALLVPAAIIETFITPLLLS